MSRKIAAIRVVPSAPSEIPVGPVPFGYQVDADTGIATQVADEALAVRGLFERKAAGDTNGQIADWLNARGLKTRTGRMFTAHTIKDMLRCRFYVGVVQHQGNEYAGQHAAIVEEELYERAQQRRRAERQPRRQRSGPASILHGMLNCGNCGSSLHSDRNQFGYPLYRERHGWPCETNGRPIVAHRVDEQIGEIIRSLELKADWRDRMAEFALADDDGPGEPDLKNQRKHLGRAYGDGAYSDAEYRVRLAEIDARIRAKTTASQPTIEEAAALFRDIPALWAEAEPDERRRLVAPLIERVYMDLESRRVGAFTPSPAFRSLLQGAVKRTRDSTAVILTPSETESLEMMAWWRRGSTHPSSTHHSRIRGLC